MSLITISRGVGCGGMVIARLVAEELEVELFDDHKLQQEAIGMGIRPEEVKELEEKSPGFFDLLMSHKPEIYLNYMEALIYEVAKRGEGVIIGHGSQMLLRDFECALHVHIYASEKSRIQNLMKQKGLNEDTARRLIKKADHEQKGFLRYAFKMDWHDPSLYDLIINTEQIGLDLAAKIIVEIACSGQMKECSLNAREAMEKLGLEKRIRATLLDKGFDLSTLFFDIPAQGKVEIHGYVSSSEEREAIPKIIKAVSGVSEVHDNIGVYKRSM